ncbi:hypothetical protein GB937_008953 [Aspergillus fischeri]|nr:hypothetical protein GB937_008953 [Aspergillus fischeri]
MTRQIHAFKIHINLLIPYFLGYVCRAPWLRSAHIIDEDIDSAVFLHAAVHQRLERRGISSICFLDVTCAAVSLFLGLCSLGRGQAAVSAEDEGPVWPMLSFGCLRD